MRLSRAKPEKPEGGAPEGDERTAYQRERDRAAYQLIADRMDEILHRRRRRTTTGVGSYSPFTRAFSPKVYA